MQDSAIESDREWARRLKRAYNMELRIAVETRNIPRIAELLEWKASHEEHKRELGIAA